MSDEDIELPPLPKASKMYDIPGYDEEELKDYARTAIQAERAALAEKDRKIAALREKANDWSMVADKYARALDRCQARNNDSLSSDAIHAVREILKSAGVPTAAFIDDHVGNAIVQRNQERTRAESADARVAELEKALANLVQEIDDLVSESEGVAGLHLNGDVAEWDDLLPGGLFERLTSLDDARAALAVVKEYLTARLTASALGEQSE